MARVPTQPFDAVQGQPIDCLEAGVHDGLAVCGRDRQLNCGLHDQRGVIAIRYDARWLPDTMGLAALASFPGMNS